MFWWIAIATTYRCTSLNWRMVVILWHISIVLVLVLVLLLIFIGWV